jgi:hypothetical protein
MVDRLKSLERDAVVEFIQEDIEEIFFDNSREYLAELDKSWDALQRMFSKNWNDLGSKDGEYPFNHLIFGSQVIYGDLVGEDDYIVTLKSQQQVHDIAKVVDTLTEAVFKEKYYAIDQAAYGYPLSEEDCEYTWDWFTRSIPFWKKASEENLFVIFTVDQ